MFCVIYQWKVKPGKEELFRQTWRTITEAIYRQHGALGSRLHRADDGSGTWIAYAQWPDREHWSSHAETLGIELAKEEQSQCLQEAVQILHTLEVTDDLLKAQPWLDI